MKILLIGKNENYLQKCADKLRWQGYQIIIHNDVFDALREILVFGVSCIVWDVETNDSARIRKYNAIKRYHRHEPLIIIDNNKEAYKAVVDSVTHFMTDNPEIEDLVSMVVSLVNVPKLYANDDLDDQDDNIEIIE